MTPANLKLVQPTADPNMNAFLYGRPKTGKTLAAASAPKPLLYLNGDSGNATRLAHARYQFDEVAVEGLQTFVDVTNALEAPNSPYKTVVLDPLVEVFRLVLESMTDRVLHPSLPAIGDAGTHLERFIRKLIELPVNVVLVAHEGDPIKNDQTGEVEYLPLVTTRTGSPVFAAKIMAIVDVIGYTGIVRQADTDPKYVAQLIDGAGRRGGDRFGVLGASREMNLTEWADLARSAMSPREVAEEGAAA
jgi:hypothetical protein